MDSDNSKRWKKIWWKWKKTQRISAKYGKLRARHSSDISGIEYTTDVTHSNRKQTGRTDKEKRTASAAKRETETRVIYSNRRCRQTAGWADGSWKCEWTGRRTNQSNWWEIRISSKMCRKACNGSIKSSYAFKSGIAETRVSGR